jgi:hypothetical protein
LTCLIQRGSQRAQLFEQAPRPLSPLPVGQLQASGEIGEFPPVYETRVRRLSRRSLRLRNGVCGRHTTRLENFQPDRAHVQAVAGEQFGVGEGPAVEPSVAVPSPDHGPSGSAQDQAVYRADAAGAKPQGAALPGADGAFGRLQPHDLAVS